jgi:molecular chaperone HscA
MVDVKPSYGLTDEEIERMLEEAIDLGEEDIGNRLLIQTRNDAEQILAALRKQLREYGSLAEADEREAMERKAVELEEASRGDDREHIASLVEELNQLSTPFAQRIMDHAVQVALEKKSIGDLP